MRIVPCPQLVVLNIIPLSLALHVPQHHAVLSDSHVLALFVSDTHLRSINRHLFHTLKN